jgi:hypothetical protein
MVIRIGLNYSRPHEQRLRWEQVAILSRLSRPFRVQTAPWLAGQWASVREPEPDMRSLNSLVAEVPILLQKSARWIGSAIFVPVQGQS